jgi:hypothetical protein
MQLSDGFKCLRGIHLDLNLPLKIEMTCKSSFLLLFSITLVHECFRPLQQGVRPIKLIKIFEFLLIHLEHLFIIIVHIFKVSINSGETLSHSLVLINLFRVIVAPDQSCLTVVISIFKNSYDSIQNSIDDLKRQ